MPNARFSTVFCRKCLYTSLSVPDMLRFVNMIDPEYDIYKRSGYPEGHPIANQDAAKRIVDDMIQDGKYVDFVEMLIKVEAQGYMGRHYDLKGMKDIVTDVIQAGYSYDKTTGQFFENQQERITRNWGRLVEGDERQMAVMRLDIAGNSILVKENPKNLIEKAYGDLRQIVTKAVVSRLGRLWSWEGDGALGVFMLGNYSRMAIMSGIEIINEMVLYNKISNPLKSEVKLRLSVHSGNLTYSTSEAECLKADTVRKAIILESKAAKPNSVVISESLAVTQDQALLNIFSNTTEVSADKYRIYQVSQKNE
jgi:class 3 adenylate cyclase